MSDASPRPTWPPLERPPEPGARNPFAILFAPRAAAPGALRAPAGVPALILALSAALASYPMLFRMHSAGLADARLAQTPSGLGPFALFFFLGTQWGAPLLLPLAVWCAAFLLSWFAVFALDVRVKQVQLRRLVMWSFLPLAIERLFVAALHQFALTDNNPFNPLASNAAFFLDATAVPPAWYEFASSLDVFTAWAIVITALAVARIANRSAGAIGAALAIIWLAGCLFRAFALG